MAKEKTTPEVNENPEVTEELVDNDSKDSGQTEAKDAAKKMTTAKAYNPLEMVEMEIPISEQQQDDWFACINGKTFQVKRGEKVKVPRYVKEVYDNQVRQERESFRRSQALQEKALRKAKEML